MSSSSNSIGSGLGGGGGGGGGAVAASSSGRFIGGQLETVAVALHSASAAELLQHAWISSHNNNQVDLTGDLTSSIDRLRATEQRRRANHRLRAVGNAITAVNWLRKKSSKADLLGNE